MTLGDFVEFLGDVIGFLGDVIENTFRAGVDLWRVLFWRVNWWDTPLEYVVFACGYYIFALYVIKNAYDEIMMEINFSDYEYRELPGTIFWSLFFLFLSLLGGLVYPTFVYAFIIGFFR